MKSINTPLMLTILVLSLGLITISSCKKQMPYNAEITVVDELDNRVEGATVMLVCTPVPPEPECFLGDTSETDGTGTSSHTIPYPSVLQVIAFKQGSPTLYGETYLKLDQKDWDSDKVSKETVVVSPQ